MQCLVRPALNVPLSAISVLSCISADILLFFLLLFLALTLTIVCMLIHCSVLSGFQIEKNAFVVAKPETLLSSNSIHMCSSAY